MGNVEKSRHVAATESSFSGQNRLRFDFAAAPASARNSLRGMLKNHHVARGVRLRRPTTTGSNDRSRIRGTTILGRECHQSPVGSPARASAD